MAGNKEKAGSGDVAAKSGEVVEPEGEVGGGDKAGNGKSEVVKTPEQIEEERKKALSLRKNVLDVGGTKGETKVQLKYGGDFFRVRDLPGMEKSKIKSEFHVTLPDMKDPKYKGKKMRVFIWFPENGGQDYSKFISKKIYEAVMKAREDGDPIALVVNRDFEAGGGHTNWNHFRNPETYSAIIDHVEKLSGGRRLANDVTIGASSGGYKGIAHILQNLKKNIEDGIQLKKIDRTGLNAVDKAKLDAELEKCERDNALYAGIRRVGLFDSLYGYEEDFSAWATSDPAKRLFSYWGTSHTTPHNKKLKSQVEKFYESKGMAVPATKTVYAAPHIGHDVGVRELAAFLREDISSSAILVPGRKTANIPINVPGSTVEIGEIKPIETGPVRVRLPVSIPSPSTPSSKTKDQPAKESEPVTPTDSDPTPVSPVTAPVSHIRSHKSYPDSSPPPSDEGAKSTSGSAVKAEVPSPPDVADSPAVSKEDAPMTSPPAKITADADTETPPETKSESPPSEGPLVYKPGKEKPTISGLNTLRSGILDEYKRHPTELFTNYPPGNPDPRANLDKIFGSESGDIKKYLITVDPLSDPNNPKPVTFLGRKILGGINMMFYVLLKIAEEIIMQSGVNYQPVGNEVLGFQDRYMKLIVDVPGNKTWSFHKPGCAVDLDPSKNGPDAPNDGRGTIPDQVVMGMVKAGMSWGLVQTDSEQYFGRDPMHFQPRYAPGSEAWMGIVNASPVGRKYWAAVKPTMDRIKRG